ncbi:MAG: putative RNase H-like nuclease (RuvC/YqgF family) [Spirosomataceae bacterium]|jgi:predicted RNase H-like nuclease (RuvC/YqgF family)
MNPLQRIKSFFKKEPPPEIPVSETVETAAADVPSNEVITEAIETVNVLAEARDEPLPHWLSSEDALRDEGVIFGLSNAEAEEKTTVIRSFFKHQTADIEKEVERLSEKIGELNLFIEQKGSRIEALNSKIETLENESPKDHNLLRTSVGLLLAIGMCVGNFFLIDHSLAPNFTENHKFIAIGVLLAGMFNLFGRFSFFHEKNSSVSWRQLLEEVSLPFAAAFFVFTQSIGNQSVWQSIALFLFVFSLFMFSGKLVLSNLSVIKSDSLAWTKNIQLQKDQVQKKEQWESEIMNFEQDVDELRIEKWKILPSLNQAEASLERYQSKRDSLIKLFESEFRLARSYRGKLSGNQLKRILE